MFDVAGAQPQRDSRAEVKIAVHSVGAPLQSRQMRDTTEASGGKRLIEAPEAA